MNDQQQASVAARQPRPALPARTTGPGRHVVLFDGRCKFCRVNAERLRRWGKPGVLNMEDFQKPSALDAFPGLSHALCMRYLILIEPDGRVFAGFEGIVRALTTRGSWSKLAYLYYVPGIKQLFDLGYFAIARIRYWLPGKAGDSCDDGACRLHQSL